MGSVSILNDLKKKDGFMKLNNKLFCLVFSLIALSNLSFAQTAADNSKVNERDGSVAELTADQQKINTKDTQITAQIRKDIMAEKNFSTYAQNIKIITMNGKVTLKGPVRTKAEQKSILKFARTVAGASNVVNEIAITPEKTN